MLLEEGTLYNVTFRSRMTPSGFDTIVGEYDGTEVVLNEKGNSVFLIFLPYEESKLRSRIAVDLSNLQSIWVL